MLIARSSAVWQPGGAVLTPTDDRRPLALEENERMAKAGERVMVVARRDFDPATFDPKGPAGDGKLLDLVQDLTFLAMIGIVDPPRAEAKAAIAKCHSAGIQVRMITGDHAVTAAAIGHELGIEGKALTGAQFAAMSDDDLKKQLDDIGVIARVAPEDKIRLVRLLQEQQNIVAMTGDGVNDAPALKKADIGVAMGITGTEVSKGAAVMILTDDNFATIVKAVEFGRRSTTTWPSTSASRWPRWWPSSPATWARRYSTSPAACRLPRRWCSGSTSWCRFLSPSCWASTTPSPA